MGPVKKDPLQLNVIELIDRGKILKEQCFCKYMYDVVQIMIGW